MKEAKPFDFAIIGAGASGLQLLFHLIHSHSNPQLSILLIDSGDRSPKSWCFWNDNASNCFPFLIEKSWSQMNYCDSHNQTIQKPISPYSYHYISSERFFNYFFKEFIPTYSNIQVVKALATNLQENPNFVSIACDNGKIYSATKVADSRRDAAQKVSIFQHFKGKFIEFEEPILNSDVLTLMDFSGHFSTNQSAVFHYILPFSEKLALIETTIFTQLEFDPTQYEFIWKEYMNTKFPGKKFKIVSDEQGSIPMQKYRSITSDKIIRIGIAGGNLKPSTGYAFVRMNEHAKAIAENLTYKKPQRFDFYDRMLLGVIKNEINQIPCVMDRLFSRVSFSNILCFLDDKSTFSDEIKLLSKIDIPLFLRQLLR